MYACFIRSQHSKEFGWDLRLHASIDASTHIVKSAPQRLPLGLDHSIQSTNGVNFLDLQNGVNLNVVGPGSELLLWNSMIHERDEPITFVLVNIMIITLHFSVMR